MGAFSLLNEMISKNINPDVYTYSILIDTLCKEEGKVKEAKNLLTVMMKEGVKPDVAYNTK